MSTLDVETPHGRAVAHLQTVAAPRGALLLGHGAGGGVHAAWIAVVEALRADELGGLPLVVGGRSAGARVACRTAAATEAVGVLCFAFPLQPPRGSQSRLDELDGVVVPTLVVQGARDPFGMPPASKLRRVVQVPGDHGLKADPEAVAGAVGRWLRTIPLHAGSARPR